MVLSEPDPLSTSVSLSFRDVSLEPPRLVPLPPNRPRGREDNLSRMPFEVVRDREFHGGADPFGLTGTQKPKAKMRSPLPIPNEKEILNLPGIEQTRSHRPNEIND
jgi:hypothetical protein